MISDTYSSTFLQQMLSDFKKYPSLNSSRMKLCCLHHYASSNSNLSLKKNFATHIINERCNFSLEIKIIIKICGNFTNEGLTSLNGYDNAYSRQIFEKTLYYIPHNCMASLLCEPENVCLSVTFEKILYYTLHN